MVIEVALTLCKCDLSMGNFYVMGWARVLQVRWDVSLQSCSYSDLN